MTAPGPGLRVMVVDDERPALDELAWMLGQDSRIDSVVSTDSAAEALRLLQEQSVDAVFTDIRMPGLSGVELAKVLSRFKVAPPVVFITAYDDHAVDAFELGAVDYLLKPVREERLTEAVRRVVDASSNDGDIDDDQIAVELGGITRFISRADVRYAKAQGDYARLITAGAAHLVRVPLTHLEEEWRDAGFIRIHRSLLISLPHVEEVRMDAGRCSVVIGGEELQVSRRHTRELRDLLVRRARPGGAGRT